LITDSLPGNNCLVILYDNGKNRLLIGVFGAEQDEDRYMDIRNLLDAELAAKDKTVT
jgi:hypothetical protein